MVLKIPISSEMEQKLRDRAAAAGKEAEQYAREVIEEKLRGPRTIDEILAPFRREVEASAMSEQELDELFQDARQRAWEEGRRSTGRDSSQ